MEKTQLIRERARQMVERARLEKKKEFDLSSHILEGRLDAVPEEVFELHSLESLILDGNDIREVPEKIRVLSRLKRLSLIDTPIMKVPDVPGLALDWVGYLRCRKILSKQNVEKIWVDADEGEVLAARNARNTRPRLVNELGLLPRLRELCIGPLWGSSGARKMVNPAGDIHNLIKNLGQLQLLESLTIFCIVLKSVPEGIRSLKQLQTLQIVRAGLHKIPEWLCDLGNLRNLGLWENDLAVLPAALYKLSRLETINLSLNRFNEIPEVVFRLQSLRRISLYSFVDARFVIRKIPPAILDLPRLESLAVHGQPIEVPPPEIVKEGVEAIKNYWRQQQEVGIDYLCEAKLIIVGEAGAGKTTLAKKIQNPDYALQPQERSTEGIDVVRWSFPAAVRVRKDSREELFPSDFKVNIWDFGGQEIYHATHQFFLTRRSLYALVADDRKEDTDFNYWLQVVELLSDRSPLLIVQNEKQNRQREIDLGKLRADFPNLREAYRTNLATNRGLNDLKRAIQQALEYLPHIGTPLPKTWSRVRTALESDPRNYISLDEYLAICQEHGFERREDKLQLSGYLHDLGIFLHFQDDPVLKNIVILKPKWGTDAVYRVLDDHAILDQRGRFSWKDLARIWSDETYAAMRDELLRLMMKFQLCYQLPGVEAYIAPQLLSPTRPDSTGEARGGLVLRYDYDFMPKGILTRCIVALSHLIAEQGLVWKPGVILAREGSRAEVIEDYPRRKITVRVSGVDPRGLLAIVDDQLDQIHASFARLKYEKLLPCTCEICQAREEPFVYPLSELKDFAAQGDKIQCRVSRKLVDAAHLIRDVLPSAVYYSPEAPLQLSEGHLLRPELLPPAEPAPRKEVFVSYAWTEESKAIVDRLQAAFEGRDVTLVRDKNELRYRDSIRDFMRRIGRGKCVVVVLSRRYLESTSCMFELTEIAERGEIGDRVFPIVLEDAGIYEAISRIRSIKHWEKKRDELDAEMKEVGGEHLHGIREELDLFAKIRGTIAGIVGILGDMNALSPGQHQETDFDALLEALEARLGE